MKSFNKNDDSPQNIPTAMMLMISVLTYTGSFVAFVGLYKINLLVAILYGSLYFFAASFYLWLAIKLKNH